MGNLWKVAVAVIGLLLAVLGLRWMLFPGFAAVEIGMVLSTPVALNTARGDIGGLFIGGAILCFLGLYTGERRWLDAVALVIACIAIGRTIGILADGFFPVSVISIVVELVMVRVLIGASRAHRAAARA
ncbi:MAG: DUF4345 domain-containing protein [Deltaproteobacteria bacterium]|nr:DUF4345 domain-containing protein [Deltaproteobacteria bacterium]